MLDDREQLRLQILLNEHKRMYRLGGRAPRGWVVNLIAVACGLAPFLLLLRFAEDSTPRLRFVAYEPIVIDLAIPLAVILAFNVLAQWIALAQRRQAMMIAAATAAVPTLGLYVASGLRSGAPLNWLIWHLLVSVGTVLALVAMWVGPVAIRTAGVRWLLLGFGGRWDRARRRDATSGSRTKPLTCSQISRHPSVEPAE